MKNKLILITVVCKNLNRFDTRNCLHTFIATNCKIKYKLLEVRGHVPQCSNATPMLCTRRTQFKLLLPMGASGPP